jgi:hypothetical protein
MGLCALLAVGCNDAKDPTDVDVAQAAETDASAIYAWTPASIQNTSGSGQSGSASAVLPQPLVARIVDWRGTGQSGVPVTFRVTAGGGQVSPAQVNTDAQGYARTNWTLGASGTQTATADAKSSRVWSLRSATVSYSATISGTTTPTPTPTGAPGAVTDLAPSATTASSVTLTWTAVGDGAGGAAKYTIRAGSPSISWSSAYATEKAVPAVQPGQRVSYTYSGLPAGTNYQFQVISYRGTLNADAVFGPRSNIASAATTGSTAPASDTAVTRVIASPSTKTLRRIDETYQITPTARNRAGETINDAKIGYTSLSPSIATVTSAGVVRARARGTAMIIVASLCCSAADTVTAVVEPTTTTEPTPPPPPSSGTPYFADNFDTGSKSSGGGFRWTGSNAISSTYASSGTHSMRFRYVANPVGEDGMAEERFVLAPDAASAPTEVWIEFMWRVPENYKHRGGPGAANNKFMTLWAENYSAANEAQFYLSLERRSDSESTLDIIAIHGDDPRYPNNAWFAGSTPFVGPADYGKWMQVRVHARLAVDGEVQVYKNGVLYNQMRNFNMVRANYNWDYFRNGYLMGWSNSGFDQQTDFYIDSFKIYKTNPGW